MVCAFTGHRPEHLPWGEDETDPRCLALKTQLLRRVEAACGQGFRTFLCGMARGCDCYFAEAVLRARLTHPHIRLVAMIPCPTQTCSWMETERARHATLLSSCDRVIVLEPQYSEGCMLRRNRAMVEKAQLLITVYDGSGGGTGATVRYARARNVKIWPLWI